MKKMLLRAWCRNLSNVSEGVDLELSKALLLEELHEALMGMESGKAPCTVFQLTFISHSGPYTEQFLHYSQKKVI